MIVDKHGRICVAFVAKLKDPTWMTAITGAARVIAHLREECLRLGLVKKEDLDHRRGKFLAIACGVSFGGGQTVRELPLRRRSFMVTGEQRPGNIVHSKRMRALLDQFLKDKNIVRIANFQSGALARFGPLQVHKLLTG